MAHSLRNEAAALASGTPTLEEIARLDERFIHDNASPGGCADLLAVMLMMSFLEQEPPR